MKLKNPISIYLLMSVLLIAVIAGVLRRELFIHDAYASKLETAQSQIKVGMTKEQVTQIAGSPDVSRKLNDNFYYHWSTKAHEGWFLKITAEIVRGDQDLNVQFDEQEKVIHVWGGMN